MSPIGNLFSQQYVLQHIPLDFLMHSRFNVVQAPDSFHISIGLISSPLSVTVKMHNT